MRTPFGALVPARNADLTELGYWPWPTYLKLCTRQ